MKTDNIETALKNIVLGTIVDGQTIDRRLKLLVHNEAILLKQCSALESENYDLRSEVETLKRQVNLLFAKVKGQNYVKL